MLNDGGFLYVWCGEQMLDGAYPDAEWSSLLSVVWAELLVSYAVHSEQLAQLTSCISCGSPYL
eukprot:SAG22_NODE_214_length_15003_cov_18.466519_14_plen_63_part_00